MSSEPNDPNDPEPGLGPDAGPEGPTAAAAANLDVSPEVQALLGAYSHGHSDMLARRQAAMRAGLAYSGERDYYDTLGYDRDPDAGDFIAKFVRNDIARTVVSAPASTAWRARPRVVDDADEGTPEEPETEFERAVEFLFDDFRLLHYLERWDIALGLGEYGLLMLGVREPDEGNDLSDPLDEGELEQVNPEDARAPTADASGGLAFLSVFTEASVTNIDLVNDPQEPRYGLPERYQIEFSTGEDTRTEWVHHSRVLHAAEDLLENEVFGTPRLLPVYNRIEDLEKVVGGSAEMFWRGARRELLLNYEGDRNPQDADDVRDQIEAMIHGLETVGTLQNTEVEQLGGDFPDPSGNVDTLLKLIAGETGIPRRILTGSERGELASTQDRATWLGRVSERQEQFCEPMLLRPLLDRLVQLGILPEPSGRTYSVEWPDLFELNELEQAELRSENADALATAAPGGDPGQLADVPEIREQIMGWDPERGAETSLDPDENPERVEDEDDVGPTDEDLDEDALDEFEDVLDGVQGGAASARAATDGGQGGE